MVLGPSGAGKSTLLRVVAGLEPADRRPGRHRRARRHRLRPGRRNVSMVFQSLRAVPAPHRRREHRLRARSCATPRRAGTAAGPRGGRRVGLRGPARPAAARSSPAASGSGSRWPGRWSASPTFPARRAAVQPGPRAAGRDRAPSSRRCTTGSAGPWCTSPTTRPRRSCSATGSPCCARAARAGRHAGRGLAAPGDRFVARFVGSPAMNLLPARRAARPRRRPAAAHELRRPPRARLGSAADGAAGHGRPGRACRRGRLRLPARRGWQLARRPGAGRARPAGRGPVASRSTRARARLRRGRASGSGRA